MNEDDPDLVHVGNSVQYKIVNGALLVTAQFPFNDDDDDRSMLTELWPSSLSDELMLIYHSDRELFEAQILQYGEMMLESALLRLMVQEFKLGSDPVSATTAEVVFDANTAATHSILEAMGAALQVALSIDDHKQKEAGQLETLPPEERVSEGMLETIFRDYKPPNDD